MYHLYTAWKKLSRLTWWKINNYLPSKNVIMWRGRNIDVNFTTLQKWMSSFQCSEVKIKSRHIICEEELQSFLNRTISVVWDWTLWKRGNSWDFWRLLGTFPFDDTKHTHKPSLTAVHNHIMEFSGSRCLADFYKFGGKYEHFDYWQKHNGDMNFLCTHGS